MAEWLSNPRLRSSVRFAIAICVVDILVLRLFGSSLAAILGSFAVAINLYFLDFDGDTRERLTGVSVASAVGCVAIVLGIATSSPLWLAVVATVLVSSAFAYARLLRGYIARSAVGLPGAFFVPLMAEAHWTDAPSLLGGWLIGCAISLVASLFLLPHRRTGEIRRLLAAWLRAAAELGESIASGSGAEDAVARLRARRDDLLARITGSFTPPGVVGRRQRALVDMIDGARWSMPIAEQFAASTVADGSPLVRTSVDGFRAAADLVESGTEASAMPDLPASRSADLIGLADLPPRQLETHYRTRLLSIGAMTQLFFAARSRGRIAPTPDVGVLHSNRPTRAIVANFRPDSVWFRNALRTGVGSATCVFLVRALGIEHGVWVVIAALAVTQVSLSGTSGVASMLKIALGAVLGVTVAGVLVALHPPMLVYVLALPVVAFASKWVVAINAWLAQMIYTIYVLANLAVLSWPPHADLEIARIENIALGAAVAGVFSLLVFPNGAAKLLRTLRTAALRSSRDYLRRSSEDLETGGTDAVTARRQALELLGAYSDAIDAAFMHSSVGSEELRQHDAASARARDLVIGGDATAEIAEATRSTPELRPVALALARWWDEFLDG